jgi:type 1 glutamine amidotransferase
MISMVKSILCLAVAATLLTSGASAAEKRIVLIAGKPSHGPGEHEFRAGCLLLQKCLQGVPAIRVEVCDQGWPKEDSALAGAAAVVVYADGGPNHPCFQGGHRQVIQDLVRQGTGIGFMHYAVEVPKGEPGQSMWEWVGGYYEDHYSCNPMWSPDYQRFPSHPISEGVQPFSVKDEWYFNMRFSPESSRRTGILVAKPSDAVRDGPYVWPAGPYAHIQANKGREETMMWTFERPDGGRGFGWTGGHHHKNWANDNYRKVVLNALLWVAKADVPAGGVSSAVSAEDLSQNLDKK